MPSGPKKRKAAKKKMESLAVSTTVPQGNGGRGSEAASPMSPEHGDRSVENKGGDGSGGGDGLSGGTVSSRDVVGRAVEEHPVVPQKAEQAEALPVPVSQPEDVGVEYVEHSKAVVPSDVGKEIPIPARSPKKAVSEEKLESSAVACVTAVEKEVAAPAGDVVEKVESSNLRQPSPSEEREEKVEALSSGPGEAEQKSARQDDAEDGINHHLQSEGTDVGTEVVSPPQAAQRTSWLSCCGLFDAFVSSSR